MLNGPPQSPLAGGRGVIRAAEPHTTLATCGSARSVASRALGGPGARRAGCERALARGAGHRLNIHTTAARVRVPRTIARQDAERVTARTMFNDAGHGGPMQPGAALALIQPASAVTGDPSAPSRAALALAHRLTRPRRHSRPHPAHRFSCAVRVDSVADGSR